MHSVVIPIDDLPGQPDDKFVGNLAHIVDSLIREGAAASVALLLSRPDPEQMRESDREWARALGAALSPRASLWPIHLATRGLVRVFAPDDLAVAS